MPPSTGSSGTQSSTLNSAGINDLEWPEKNSNTEVKYGATRHLTPPVVNYKNLKTKESLKSIKNMGDNK
jgi:hypothetical protein